ncbi:hypothetical protein [uncultured Bacteroides sp.]|uniref:hypothetical protein n=1 Tax=uncultured Bacteroides sp. TaxID=162156 RepID=UPI002637A20A|nr:hypothetical protein [uncultured Bacteroides sp.]
MKKEFDFDDIGKRTPYRVPEGFFEDMQQKVRQHTYGSKPAVRRFRMVIAASMAVAAVLASLLFMPSHFRQAGRGTSDLQTLDIENRKIYESKICLCISGLPYGRLSIHSLCSEPGK